MSDAPCVCPSAGYCQRYQRYMLAYDYDFCREDAGLTAAQTEKFRNYWKTTPGNELAFLTRAVFRLGDFVAHWIKACSFGLITQKSGCGCARRQDKLNAFGDWLRKMMCRKTPMNPSLVTECQKKKQQLDASISESILQATNIKQSSNAGCQHSSRTASVTYKGTC